MASNKSNNMNQSYLQKQIKEITILLIGAGPDGCEVAKNLALSGFPYVDILDDSNVQEKDVNAQKLFSKTSIGENKAIVTGSLVRLFSPKIKMNLYSESIDGFFKNGTAKLKAYNYVITALDDNVKKNQVYGFCLKAKTPIIAMDVSDKSGKKVTMVDNGSMSNFNSTSNQKENKAIDDSLARLVVLHLFDNILKYSPGVSSMSTLSLNTSESFKDDFRMQCKVSKKSKKADEYSKNIRKLHFLLFKKEFATAAEETKSFIQKLTDNKVVVPESLKFLYAKSMYFSCHNKHDQESKNLKMTVISFLEDYLKKRMEKDEKSDTEFESDLLEANLMLSQLYLETGKIASSLDNLYKLLELLERNEEMYAKQIADIHNRLKYLNYHLSYSFALNSLSDEERDKEENKIYLAYFLKLIFENEKYMNLDFHNIYQSYFFDNLKILLEQMDEDSSKYSKPRECFKSTIAASDKLVTFTLFMALNAKNDSSSFDKCTQKILDKNPIFCVIHKPFLREKWFEENYLRKIKDRYHLEYNDRIEKSEVQSLVLIRKLITGESVRQFVNNDRYLTKLSIRSYLMDTSIICFTNENSTKCSYEEAHKNCIQALKNCSSTPTFASFIVENVDDQEESTKFLELGRTLKKDRNLFNLDEKVDDHFEIYVNLATLREYWPHNVEYNIESADNIFVKSLKVDCIL